MEGIRLSKTSLVMKTGESKTLTVSFLPENTTEQPDVIWSSAIWCGDLNLDHGSFGNAGLLYGGNKLWEFRVTPCKSAPQVLKFK